MTAWYRLRLFRWVFGLAAIVFLVVAFASTWDQTQGIPVPKWWELAGAGVFAWAVLPPAARAWACLMTEDRTPALVRSFYSAQLGKHIPGGVWQAVGQVGLAYAAGIPMRKAAVAYPVHALTQLAAGATAGSMTLFLGSDLPTVWRFVAAVGFLGVILIRRNWMSWAVTLLSRLINRDLGRELVPQQSAIWRSYGWNLLTIIATGVSFWWTLLSLSVDVGLLSTVVSFAAAWAIGFLALPFPSGLGVREAVLVGLLGAQVPTPLLLSAAVIHRFLTILAEGAMWAVGTLSESWKRGLNAQV